MFPGMPKSLKLGNLDLSAHVNAENVVTHSIARQVEGIITAVLTGLPNDVCDACRGGAVAGALQQNMDAGALPGFVYLDDLMKADAWERLQEQRTLVHAATALVANDQQVDALQLAAMGYELRVRWAVYGAILAQTN